MPWSGSGSFTRSYNWVNDRDAAINITASRMDGEDDNFATGINACLTKSGENAATANLPMGGFKHTNVANASARTEYATAGQIEDGSFTWCGTSGGTANAITLTPSPAITTYTAGQTFRFIAASDNTTAVTVAVSGLTTKNITRNGSTALVQGDIVSGAQYQITYDGTRFQLTTSSAVARTTGFTSTGDITMSSSSVLLAEGAAVASTATTDIWTTDGNTRHVTGNNTISSFGTATQAGAHMWVVFDGTPTLTQGANLNLNNGGSSVTIEADDIALVYADTTTQHDVTVFKKSGRPTAGYPASQGCSDIFVSATTISGTPTTIEFDSVMDSTYDYYEWELVHVQPTTDAVILQGQVAKSGTTWETGAGDYVLNVDVTNHTGAGDVVKSAGTTLMSFTDDAVGIGNDAGVGLSGKIYCYGPSTASKYKIFGFELHYVDAAGSISVSRGNCTFTDGAAVGTGAAAIVSFKLFLSSTSTFQNNGKVVFRKRKRA